MKNTYDNLITKKLEIKFFNENYEIRFIHLFNYKCIGNNLNGDHFFYCCLEDFALFQGRTEINIGRESCMIGVNLVNYLYLQIFLLLLL